MTATSCHLPAMTVSEQPIKSMTVSSNIRHGTDEAGEERSQRKAANNITKRETQRFRRKQRLGGGAVLPLAQLALQ